MPVTFVILNFYEDPGATGNGFERYCPKVITYLLNQDNSPRIGIPHLQSPVFRSSFRWRFAGTQNLVIRPRSPYFTLAFRIVNPSIGVNVRSMVDVIDGS